MDDKFRDVQAEFDRLTARFGRGEISRREYVSGLKRIRFKDEEGRFWMIGTQTGRWYYYDKQGWVQSAPPSFGDRKAICIYCGFENDLEAPVCAGCGGRVGAEGEETGELVCLECGAPLDPGTGVCLSCSSGKIPASGAPEAEAPLPTRGSGVRVIRSFEPLSALWFCGGLGIVAGVLTGLLAGATAFLPGIADALPMVFKEMQGKLLGGMVFAGLGGLAGFAFFGAAGFLLSLLANGILSFTGGLKVRLEEPFEKGPEDRN